MKKLILIIFMTFTFASCGNDVKPNVTVNSDINLTIDDKNLEEIQGEWTITSEEKNEDGKETIIITIVKKDLN